MTIRHIDTVNAVCKSPEHISKKENGLHFSELLENRKKAEETVGNNCFKRYESSIFVRKRVIEQRPSCIICGMTISSEGTCLCEYPTVINFHGTVNLKRNGTSQTECSETSKIPAENKEIQVLGDNTTEQDTEKIKLRHRCLICGKVSDDGSCMCDFLNRDKNSGLRSTTKINVHFMIR